MSDSIAKIYPMTDMGNARMFADMFGDKVRYDKTTGKWMAWDGRRWSREDGQTQAEMYCRGVSMYWHKKLVGAPDKKTGREIFRHWQYSSSATGARNLLYFAKSEPGIAVSYKELDTHPYLLNVLDGTIDLKTGRIREHRPSDLITQLADVAYCADIEHPKLVKWQQSLKDWHRNGNTDGTWEYLQKLAGLCLTGDIGSRCMFIFWGKGMNGKNGFVDPFYLMLGDYSAVASRTLINARSMDQHPTEIATLWKKRLVVASEPEKGNRLKVGLVKAMTGDIVLNARFMRQDEFFFKPTHKIIMMTQNLPAVEETEDAIWDRLHKIPWLTRIPKEERIPDYGAVYLRDEYTGILRWAIEGYQKLLRQPVPILAPTKLIENETKEYRDEQNPAKKFVDSLFHVSPGMFTPSSTVNRLFSEWIEFGDEKLMPTKTELVRYLNDAGCVNKLRKMEGRTERGWFGLGIRSIDF